MKVLKKGRDQKGRCRKYTCTGRGGGGGGCGAKLLVSEADVKSRTYHEMDGGTDTCHWFVCPECGVETYVSDDAF